ncbi:rod shape-determining protein MreD [Floccifex sp.]|uniref:rod shape-determining protein MreD n=1 Tax=Floccifex sp. TaxID=2815810 RepID=UPI003F10EFAF
MKNRFYLILFLILALLDQAIVYLFPVDYTYQGFSFVPHLCLAAFLISIYKRNWLDRILMGLLFGIAYDALFQNGISFHILWYPFLSYCCGFFQEQMDQDNKLLLTVVWFLVVCIDVIPFLYFHFKDEISISIIKWMIHFELATALIHIVCIATLVYIFNVYDRYQEIQRIRNQKLEKKKYRNLRLSRK